MSSPPPRVKQAVQDLREGAAHYQETSLQDNRAGSVIATINKQACRDTGHLENPGTADQYYFRDKGVIVLDLEGDFNGDNR